MSESTKEAADLEGVKARNRARHDFHSRNPSLKYYAAEAFMRAMADCDLLIAIIEGEPTALEKGASVDDVMQEFEDNYAGLFES
jgi:hypothetical protein